ncbi:unnamed protein product [Closterium sp. Naga37s-1]|nr:unnamed protein product [Closterium sp. Naga37s-1]
MFADSEFFQQSQMNDASEVLPVIFDCLHRAFTEPASEPAGGAAGSASEGASSVKATAVNFSTDDSFIDPGSSAANQKQAGSWDCPASTAAWDRAYLAASADSSALGVGSVPNQTTAPGQRHDVGPAAGSGTASGSGAAAVSASPLSYGAVVARGKGGANTAAASAAAAAGNARKSGGGLGSGSRIGDSVATGVGARGAGGAGAGAGAGGEAGAAAAAEVAGEAAAAACIAHGLFGLDVTEIMRCSRCGLQSRQMRYSSFFHHANATALRLSKLGNPTCRMDELLAGMEQHHLLPCDVEVGGCGHPNAIQHVLRRAPPIFTTVLGWQSDREEAEDIGLTLGALDVQLDVGVVYRGLPGPQRVRVVCVVCYYGRHYHCFSFHADLGKWVMFDDTTVKVVGGWADVVSSCIRGRLQPQVLFYEAC